MHSRVVDAMRRLQRERRTGVFKTSAAAVNREIVLEKGAIVGAHSSSSDERLGEVMVRRGRISERELEDASKLVRSGRRLGDVLVELRIVERDEVEGFVRAQLTEIASKFLTDPPQKLEFQNCAAVGKTTENPVSIADAILEASRNIPGPDEELLALVEPTLIPMLAKEATAAMETMSLQSHEAFVLSRCDGQSLVRDILAQSPLSDAETSRILLGLEHAGVVEMRGRTAAGH